MGQWKIVETDIPSVTTGMEIIGYNVDRVSVFITNISAPTVYVSSRPPPQLGNAGILVSASLPLRFQWAVDGEITRSQLYAYGASSGQMHVLEVIYYPSGDENGNA